jgi:hypothetical protein
MGAWMLGFLMVLRVVGFTLLALGLFLTLLVFYPRLGPFGGDDTSMGYASIGYGMLAFWCAAVGAAVRVTADVVDYLRWLGRHG